MTQPRFGPVRDRRPLSVQVYDRLVDTLRESSAAGQLVPTEVELANDLGVSRTVLREALRLLEEDGVIERARDPRRRQLASPASRPPAFNAPLEQMVRAPRPLQVEVVRTEPVKPTRWSRPLLELDGDGLLLLRESVFLLDGEAVASALELVPMDDGKVPAHLLVEGVAGAQTLLSALGPQFRSKCVPTTWRLGPGSSSGSRARFDKAPHEALTSLTTVLSRNGKPAFLAKYLLMLGDLVLAVGADADGEADF